MATKVKTNEKAKVKVATEKTTSKKVESPNKTTTKTKSATKEVTPEKKEKFVAHSSSLQVGQKAPVFSGVDQNGTTISSKDFKGKKVVLYFYPKDDTPGCTAQACSLRDEYAFLTKQNYAVVGVSADDIKKHKKFTDKYQLPFPLIADVDKNIISSFDVWGKKQFMGKIFDGIIRTTFIIDEKGKIETIIRDVDTKSHGKQVLN